MRFFKQYYLDIIDALCDQADLEFSCKKVDSNSFCNTQLHSTDFHLDVKKVINSNVNYSSKNLGQHVSNLQNVTKA
jgi:hypothetical protein